MPHNDSTDKLLDAIDRLTVQVQEVRDEGRGRHDANVRAQEELRREVTIMGRVVAEHGISVNMALDKLDSHHRLIQALTESSASNTTLLAKHAELITNLGEAIAGAKERAREAQQSATDLKRYTEDFQASVTRHVSEQTMAIQADMVVLKASNVTQDDKLALLGTATADLTVSTSAIVGALELQTQVEQARKGLPPDRKDRTALDTLRSKGQGTLIASIVGCILIALKIAYEVMSQGHVLPPVAAPVIAPPAQIDTHGAKP